MEIIRTGVFSFKNMWFWTPLLDFIESLKVTFVRFLLNNFRFWGIINFTTCLLSFWAVGCTKKLSDAFLVLLESSKKLKSTCKINT